jgi:hypothetical protein
MLTEDAVINLLCKDLRAGGWEIVSRAMPDQHGTDVVAIRAGVRLEVEAKGEGSSKPHTARYGQPFNQAQVRVHVAEAVLKALAVVAGGRAQAAIAFPQTRRHHLLVDPIHSALGRLGITVFWVGEDGTVGMEDPSDAN